MIVYDPANPAEYAAYILMDAARLDHWPREASATREMVRAARSATHPDLHAGDRARWDLVDWAITVMGLRESRAVP